MGCAYDRVHRNSRSKPVILFMLIFHGFMYVGYPKPTLKCGKNKRRVETRRFTFAYDPLFKLFGAVVLCTLNGVITYVFPHGQPYFTIHLVVDAPDKP